MRLVVRLIVIVLFVAGAVFFADHPGHVSLVWEGWRIETSVALLSVVILVTAIIVWLIATSLSRILDAPRRLAHRRREARRLQGYRALTDGLVAIAAGDPTAADRLSRNAEKLFKKSHHPPPPLTRLIRAQSALLRHDHVTAKSAFTALADHDETEFLGLRGLIVQALKAGDEKTALTLIERADRRRPGTAWVLQSRLSLEARARSWRQVHETINYAARHRAISADRATHHRMAVWLTRSREAITDGRPRDALTYAAQAYGIDPSFPPLAKHYAECLAGNGEKRKALRTIETSWARSGDASLLALYDQLLGSEPTTKRLQRIEKLVASRPHESTGHLAAASMALTARLWGEARRHLALAGSDGPGPWPAALCRLCAELAQGERQDSIQAQLWRDRQVDAPREKLWICAACGGESAEWEPLCPHCQDFDMLEWRVPGTRGKAPESATPRDEFPLLDLPVPSPSAQAAAMPLTVPIDIEAAARSQTG